MKKLLFILALMVIVMSSCSDDTEHLIDNSPPLPNYLYRMNGDYADKVFVGMDETRSRIIWTPDLRDAEIASQSIEYVTNGFYTGAGFREEVGFVTWTYEEFAAFKSKPSDEEFMKHLIPGAKVTEVYACYRLPPSSNSKAEFDQFLKGIVEAGFPDCALVYRAE